MATATIQSRRRDHTTQSFTAGSASKHWTLSPSPKNLDLSEPSRSFSLRRPAVDTQTPCRTPSSRYSPVATQRRTVNNLPHTPDSAGFEPPRLLFRDLDQYPRGHTPLLTSQWESPSELPLKPALQARRSRRYHAGRDKAHGSRSTLGRSGTGIYSSSGSPSEESNFPLHRGRPSDSSSNMSASQSSTTVVLAVNTDKSLPGTPSHNARSLKSPGNPLASFFSWRRPTVENNVDSPPASLSGSSSSQSSSPTKPGKTDARLLAPNSQIRQATDKSARNSIEAFSALPLLAPEVMKHVDSLVAELRAVGAELAASIGREMQLEDELDLCKLQVEPSSNTNDAGKRTSDYYSDSGASSTRLPAADTELKMQGLEKMRRKAEQEKAQMRIDMAQKVQADLNERKALQMHVQALEEEFHAQARHHTDSMSDKERQLEAALMESKTKIFDRKELEACANERDNLRDEVVPRLHDRAEALESEIQELQNVTYENTRLQQDVHWLRNENQTLINARRLQLETQQQRSRYQPRSVHVDPLTPDSTPDHPLRSSSLHREKSLNYSEESPSKVASVMTDCIETESPSDTTNGLQAQRDVLHQTLRTLMLRREVENRQFAKKIKVLEQERDHALSDKPQRNNLNSNVQYIRREMGELKTRAKHVIERKWQCEEALATWKMNLNQAGEQALPRPAPPCPPLVLMSSPSSVYDDHIGVVSALNHQDAGDEKLAGLGLDTGCGTKEHSVSTPYTQNTVVNGVQLHAREDTSAEQKRTSYEQRIDILGAELRTAEVALLAAQACCESALSDQENRLRAITMSRDEHARRLVRLVTVTSFQSSPRTEGQMSTPLLAQKTAYLDLETEQHGRGEVMMHFQASVMALEAVAGKIERIMGVSTGSHTKMAV